MGIDPVQWPNRLKLMMAANAEWVVPASFDERLGSCGEVAGEWQGDIIANWPNQPS